MYRWGNGNNINYRKCIINRRNVYINNMHILLFQDKNLAYNHSIKLSKQLYINYKEY